MRFSLLLRAGLISNVDWVVLGFVQLSFEYFQGWILYCAPRQTGASALTGDFFFPLVLKPQFSFLEFVCHLLWEESNSVFSTG